MRIYISGPMTGHPNYEMDFAKAEGKLRAAGHDAVNPARLGDIIRTEMDAEKWLTIDLALLSVCDAIFMMDGWKDSRGANRELGYALGSGIRVFYEGDPIGGSADDR